MSYTSYQSNNKSIPKFVELELKHYSFEQKSAFEKAIICLKNRGILKIDLINAETEALKYMLAIPEDVANKKDIISLFGEQYTPGTFTLAERKNNPSFLYEGDNQEYMQWIKAVVYQDLHAISRVFPKYDLNEKFYEKLCNAIIELLEFQLSNGKTINEMIYNQEYVDIIRRIINIFLTGNPEEVIDIYKDYKQIGEKVVNLVLEEFQKENLTIYDYMKLSIASGLVGLNMKSTASAASIIIDKNIIALAIGTELKDKSIFVRNRLRNKIREKMAISFWPEYEEEIVKTKKPIYLCSFTDDFIETIFQMKFHEKLLGINKNITICLVPKYSCYGNDASYMDVMQFLEKPILRKLRIFQISGRYSICKNGPRLGTMNGLKISSELASILRRCDYIEIKGARAYEMIQGIRKVAYIMFAVCREISESVTGVNAELGKLVLIRQEPGIPSFEGFKLRMERIKTTPVGRTFGLSRSTAKEFSSAIRSKVYENIINHFKNRDEANEWIKMKAQEKGVTFVEMIKHYRRLK